LRDHKRQVAFDALPDRHQQGVGAVYRTAMRKTAFGPRNNVVDLNRLESETRNGRQGRIARPNGSGTLTV